jgi:hypothetical protein
MTQGNRFPGPPGFFRPGIPGDPITGDDLENMNHKRPPHRPPTDSNAQEIRHLNQYMGYFSTPEGDVPVSVVADSIKEAAKMFIMPGVHGEESKEPILIKFVKGRIGVMAPQRKTGFRVAIEPQGALDSGAFATPSHADVTNGTEVIFTANEPFGWRFRGWFKNGHLLSTDRVSTIEVYDPHFSLIDYVARYDFNPVLRNGRYLELGHGWYFDFKFDGWAGHEGRVVMYLNFSPGPRSEIPPRGELPNTTGWNPAFDHHWVISSYDQATQQITLISDQSVVQDREYGATFTLQPTAIGFNLIVDNVTIDNQFGLVAGQQLSLKWVGDNDQANTRINAV